MDNGKYYYIGARVLIVGGTELVVEDFKKDDKKYTWSETFLADIFGSKYAYGENIMGKMNNRVFVWGVSDNPKIESVTVDGQKIDEVHTIDVDGKEYYLWIIYDLQTENKIADVVIEEN